MDVVESCSTPEGAVQAVHWCVSQGVDKLHVLKELINKHFRFQAKISSQPDLCTDILLKVIESGNDELLEVILPHVSEDFLLQNWVGKTLVTRLLCIAVENGNSKIVRLLSGRGAEGATDSSYRGRPMLHLAVLAGHLDVAGELLAAGADVMSTDIRRDPLLTTVISDSTEQRKEEKVVWLLKKGADPKACASSGKEPIHVAAAHSGPIIVHLIKAGCDVNTQDHIKGDTPLHIACARCCECAILTLVQHGAKFNLLNNHGETPLEKLLKFAQNVPNFHSKTRIILAKSLVKIGFECHQKIRAKNQHRGNSRRVGRNKVADVYKTVMATMKSTGGLQHLCRLKVRDEVRGQSFEKSVACLEVPKLVKDYLMFKDSPSSVTTIKSLADEL
ncbi:LOW QUALITY PROTEIN: ankyrin repeat and SOCS box protein 16-like [Pecten maximus]|uniref:LOW QUALITY PROTEIN: ankyrin repeat and SOCS box protein 16-like n=1 Tax=Pecten maximus TaxID=6579 RepID=UPI001458EF09|nr:LOW QUALITY PROTEIN: ankyrin repeat and SOCS box protein 16-like [Pecten maximus]